MMTQEQCWNAIEHRDRTFDGRFFFGVTTTGVYCRPSCPSRRPLRKNVRFYATPSDAERDGLRPCLRCRPLEKAEDFSELCRFMEEHSEERLDLAALAAKAGISRFHLQRRFKAAVGVSPKQYLDAVRMRRLKEGLRQSRDVAAAVYDAGFGSSSRVYERADSRLGMTPHEYRRGAPGITVSYAIAATPLGKVLIAATARGICAVQFGESDEELIDALRREYPGADAGPMGAAQRPEFGRWIEALNAHLRGSHSLHLPLDIQATAFQKRVWDYLQSIPYGEVRSYSDVASAIGRPSAVRAVARACASNRVAIAIPCHRVIRGTGELGGYRWGIERKQKLLDRERSARTA